MVWRCIKFVGIVMCAVAHGGCASDVTPGSDALEAAQTALPTLTLPELGTSPPAIRGSPTEVYTRIARGAVTCWFGAHGPLKGTHVYHAVANPPSKGGQARILIHKLDASRKDKRGVRAYAVDIVPEGKTARLEIQNAKMEEPRGSEMAQDARRWASGQEGCVAKPVAAGWDTQAPAKATKKRKAKRK